MAEVNQVDILDYFIFLNKWKKTLLIMFFSILVVAYLAIYFFIPPQYDSTTLIIPSESDNSSGLTSLLKNFSTMPIGNILGSKKSSDVNIYKTIVFSRTNLEKIVDKFDLKHEYKENSREKTIIALSKSIATKETDEGAFEITTRTVSPQESADMANYIVTLLNETVVSINVQKSHENSVFLERRLFEIKDNLKHSEDSLRLFSEKSGFYSPLDQAKSITEAYYKLESELISKQFEFSVLNKLYGAGAPQTKNAEIVVNEFESKLDSLKNNKKSSDLIAPISTLPEKTMNYLRLFRDVKIYNSMLEFILPLYEESKFEEQKNTPILHIIDKAIAPEKKSSPQRVLLSLIISFLSCVLFFVFVLIKELIYGSPNEKIILLRKELFRFKKT